MYAESTPGPLTFTVSRGWLEKFFKRYELTIRRQSAIGNVDETPCWMDMPGETTMERAGVISVPLRTTGHEKARFIVVFGAMADGSKLPFVILKGIRPIPELSRIQGGVVAYSPNGWMNVQLTKDWVLRVWGSLSFSKSVLVWGAYRCHIMYTVKSVVTHSTNSLLSIIPGGLTKQLQPADISWNKPFKESYRKLYDEWMATGEKSFTPAGNMRPLPKPTVAQWVKTAWDVVSADIIKKYFRVSGISLKLDGSEMRAAFNHMGWHLRPEMTGSNALD